MKKKKIFLPILLFALFICIPIFCSENVNAATKISAKSITLIKGQKKALKITGSKSKVKWSSNKKSVAAVSSKGIVTAKKNGTAVITAKVKGKKYKCKVIVKNKALSSFPKKPLVFGDSCKEHNRPVKLNSISAKLVQYKEFSDYKKIVTSDQYFYPYVCKIKVTGSTSSKYSQKRIWMTFATEKNGIITNLFGNIGTLIKINKNGTFSAENTVRFPNDFDRIYVKSCSIVDGW